MFLVTFHQSLLVLEPVGVAPWAGDRSAGQGSARGRGRGRGRAGRL